MAVSVTDVRPRLNKTSTVDDDEIQRMIDAAEAEFEDLIGPLSVSTYTEEFSGPVALLRRPVVAVLSVTDSAVVLDVASYALRAASGVLMLPSYGGPFAVTYTAGWTVLPANYEEAIIADVAGYFSRTQRGGSVNRPAFPGDDFAEAPAGFDAGPVSMWPRIAALAGRRGPAIA